MNNTENLLILIGSRFNELEDVAYAMFTSTIDTDEGVLLDNRGARVGQPRDGHTDEDYRRLIRARIATNRSAGSVEDLIKIARLVVGDDDVYYHVEGVDVHLRATRVLRLEDAATPSALAEILMGFVVDGQTGGTRTILESNTAEPALQAAFETTVFDGTHVLWDRRDSV